MSMLDDAKKIAGESGNTFHAKVTSWLAEHGWHVIISPYYVDQAQGKARELDLVAEKLFAIDTFGASRLKYVAVRLFIECKYVPAASVFWFADRDAAATENLVCQGGIFRMTNEFAKKHHYLTRGTHVAKLFASSSSREHENEPFYRALNQSLNAMVSMRSQPVSKEIVRPGATIEAVLSFPVIVCNSFDSLFSVDFGSAADPVPLRDNFQLEVRYAFSVGESMSREEYFLIDIVDFSRMEKFIAEIDVDGSTAAFLSGN